MTALTGSLEKIVHGPIADAPFEQLAFVFKDNAEQTIYEALLNNENQSFELSFDKEKVWLNVDGFGNIIDKTKPEVHVNPGSKSIVMFLESKFAGIIKLVAQKTENPLPGPIPTPTPQTPTGKKISFTKKSAKKADLSELRKGDKEAQGVELEVQPFTLNTERHGQKTFEKIVFIDNQNQNSDKLAFLLDPANLALEINFLNNAKIDKWEHNEGGLISEQPNVTWKTGNEKELNVYLNDVFGFKPNEITINRAEQDQPEIPKPGKDDNNPDKNKPTPQEINEVSEKLKKQSKMNNLTELENALAEAKKLKDKGATSPELEAELKKCRDKLEKLKKDQTNSSSDFFRKEVLIPLVLVVFCLGIIIFFIIKRKKEK